MSILMINPAGIYWFKVNNGKSKRYDICSKLTVKTPNRRQITSLQSENNPDEISFRQSDAVLPRGFYRNFVWLGKCQKCSRNRGTLVPATTIYEAKCPFILFWTLLYYFRLFPDSVCIVDSILHIFLVFSSLALRK